MRGLDNSILFHGPYLLIDNGLHGQIAWSETLFDRLNARFHRILMLYIGCGSGDIIKEAQFPGKKLLKALLLFRFD